MKKVKQKALLVDITECVGCGACSEACKKENGLPGEVAKSRDWANYTVLRDEGDDVYVREMCMHCVEPSCQSACPVEALHKTPEGPVVYDYDLCIGCRYCMVACPFDVPKYEWHEQVPRVAKCIMCHETRVSKGLPTACSQACVEEGAGATLFGDRNEMLAEAKKRIRENPDTYHPEIFGELQVGGTNVLFIGPEPFEALHFKSGLPDYPLSELTWGVLNKIPLVVPVWGTLLAGLWWIHNRKLEVKEKEGKAQ